MTQVGLPKGVVSVKVYISVDMEGVAGVTRWNETNRGEADYEYFRKLMAAEASAAAEAAFAAGASTVVVRDAHDSACNILPDELDPRALLIRAWSGGLYSMMEGIDPSFDCVMFIGYHAKANTRNAILKHTMSLGIRDLKVNGVSLPEAGWNALIAGMHGVPVAVVSGDRAICEQCVSLFGDVETVAVKDAIGTASVNKSPAVAREEIREAVLRALGSPQRFTPYVPVLPCKVEICYNDETLAERASWYPGACRESETSVSLVVEDFLDGLRFYHFVG